MRAECRGRQERVGEGRRGRVRRWFGDWTGGGLGLQTPEVKTALVASTEWTLSKGVCVCYVKRLSY